MTKLNRLLFGLAVIFLPFVTSCQQASLPDLDGEIKEATDSTKKINDALVNYLDIGLIEDSRDYERATRGWIDSSSIGFILGETDTDTVYSMNEFKFIQGKAPETVNPSFWRQSHLNRLLCAARLHRKFCN